ncbi:unnamed protein product [Vitrella brassicaformis CCMP3155]|uniref:RNA helicase n=2 Tax=Vitrella brassicaformis TaxID=1169539 RepID=A0A0G4FZ89_VITBC|nr:unnamed protein product [Vitrella brassicaformis CCMP3155]|eukprot:CEM20404.1 unnamed protein product [Vitrella brassicaformis CCMP3155]
MQRSTMRSINRRLFPLIHVRHIRTALRSATPTHPKKRPQTSDATATDLWSPYRFEDLGGGIHPVLIEAMRAQGIDRPTTIQQRSYDLLAEGRDCVVASETGSGKTLAYLLPLLNQLYHVHDWVEASRAAQDGQVNPLKELRPWVVLALTRDLCAQICQMAQSIDPLGRLSIQTLVELPKFPHSRAGVDPFRVPTGPLPKHLRHLRGIDPSHSVLQDLSLQRQPQPVIAAPRIRWGAVDLVVTTPIKFLQDLLRFVGESVYPSCLVFDEVDEHFQSVTRNLIFDIVKHLRPRPPIRQYDEIRRPLAPLVPTQFVFVGATQPTGGWCTTGAMIIERFHVAEQLWTAGLHAISPLVSQRWLEVPADKNIFEQKLDMLLTVLNQMPKDRTLIFTTSVGTCRRLYHLLSEGGWPAVSFHRSMTMDHRMRSADKFFRGEAIVMVATNLGGRGVDFFQVDHVINFDFPNDAGIYLSRVGRTGRVGRKGHVTNFVDPQHAHLASAILEKIEEGSKIHSTFSRKRAFRNKLRGKIQTAAFSEMKAKLMDKMQQNVKRSIVPTPSNRPPAMGRKSTRAARSAADNAAAAADDDDWESVRRTLQHEQVLAASGIDMSGRDGDDQGGEGQESAPGGGRPVRKKREKADADQPPQEVDKSGLIHRPRRGESSQQLSGHVDLLGAAQSLPQSPSTAAGKKRPKGAMQPPRTEVKDAAEEPPLPPWHSAFADDDGFHAVEKRLGERESVAGRKYASKHRSGVGREEEESDILDSDEEDLRDISLAAPTSPSPSPSGTDDTDDESPDAPIGNHDFDIAAGHEPRDSQQHQSSPGQLLGHITVVTGSDDDDNDSMTDSDSDEDGDEGDGEMGGLPLKYGETLARERGRGWGGLARLRDVQHDGRMAVMPWARGAGGVVQLQKKEASPPHPAAPAGLDELRAHLLESDSDDDEGGDSDMYSTAVIRRTPPPEWAEKEAKTPPRPWSNPSMTATPSPPPAIKWDQLKRKPTPALPSKREGKDVFQFGTRPVDGPPPQSALSAGLGRLPRRAKNLKKGTAGSLLRNYDEFDGGGGGGGGDGEVKL